MIPLHAPAIRLDAEDPLRWQGRSDRYVFEREHKRLRAVFDSAQSDGMTSENYRKHREQLGLTQAGLAARLGLPRTAIVKREAGEQRITEEAALAILSLSPTQSVVAQNAPDEVLKRTPDTLERAKPNTSEHHAPSEPKPAPTVPASAQTQPSLGPLALRRLGAMPIARPTTAAKPAKPVAAAASGS